MTSIPVDEPVFVDTNILVYAYQTATEPRHDRALLILNDLLASQRLRISTQVLHELFVTLTRRSNPKHSSAVALARMDVLADDRLFAPDYAAIREACLLSDSAQISYWDALIVVSARRSGATVLLTEDLNHGQTIAGVHIVNPFR